MPIAVKLSKFLKENEIAIGDKITNGKLIWEAIADGCPTHINPLKVPFYLKCDAGHGHINSAMFTTYWMKDLKVLPNLIKAYKFVVEPSHKEGSMGFTENYYLDGHQCKSHHKDLGIPVENLQILNFDFIQVHKSDKKSFYSGPDAAVCIT